MKLPLHGGQRLLLLCSMLAPFVSLAVVPVNKCFVEPTFSLALSAGGTQTSYELVLHADALSSSSCPLASSGQLAQVTVVNGARDAPTVHVQPSPLGLTLSITSPIQAAKNVLQVMLNDSTLFAAPLVFYDTYHLDRASVLEGADGAVSFVGQGRAFPSLPKLPGLRVRVRSSLIQHDMQQWQLVTTSANATTVREVSVKSSKLEVLPCTSTHFCLRACRLSGCWPPLSSAP